jgi:hypothetical protein
MKVLYMKARYSLELCTLVDMKLIGMELELHLVRS